MVLRGCALTKPCSLHSQAVTGRACLYTPLRVNKHVWQAGRRSSHNGRSKGRAGTISPCALHLHSREELNDGSVMFRFGKEPSTAVSENASKDQQHTPQMQASAVAQEPEASTELSSKAGPNLDEGEPPSAVASPEPSSKEATTALESGTPASAASPKASTDSATRAVEDELASNPDLSADTAPMPNEGQAAPSNGVQAPQSESGQQPEQERQTTLEPQWVTNSLDESVDEYASDSDYAFESLADMTPDKLEQLKVPQLKNLCKQEQVKGYSKLKRRELVNLLQKELQSR